MKHIVSLTLSGLLGVIVAVPSAHANHNFQLEASSRPDGQFAINAGLIQLAMGGFNVAGDFQWNRWVFEYSHGALLDYNRLSGMALSQADRDSGVDLDSPWTTGFGVSYTLIDELRVGAEFKLHNYEAAIGDEAISYTTASVGPVLTWRYYFWRGLHANIYLRYWPNVWSNLADDEHMFASGASHEAKDLGLFANVSLGWAF